MRNSLAIVIVIKPKQTSSLVSLIFLLCLHSDLVFLSIDLALLFPCVGLYCDLLSKVLLCEEVV